MKLKIVETGWAGYEGDLCGVPFVNGESVREVTDIEANKIGSMIRVETMEGEQAGYGQSLRNIQNTPAPVVAPMAEATEEEVTDKPAAKPEQNSPEAQAQKAWTLEELAEIADKSGIDGLRDVANQYGVRGKGIRELIEKILDYQKQKGIR